MGQPGDGYKDDPSPHTVKEEFLGVNMNNATWVSMSTCISIFSLNRGRSCNVRFLE